MTKDRIGGLVVAVAAVIGLFLVFDGRQAPGGDDDGPTGGTSTGQVQQAPGQPPGVAPAAPGRPADPGQSGVAPAQPGAPAAPAPPKQDDDGDGD